MKKYNLLLVALVLLCSCATNHHIAMQCMNTIEPTAGFWTGVWHGSISLFAFIASLFNDNVSIYDINNCGKWYEFGYILGIGGVLELVALVINFITK